MKTNRGVLLADDSPDDITFVRLAFRTLNLDHALTTVPGGGEALEYLRGEGMYADREKYPLPSLLLLDLRMPTVDGFEVIRSVRADPVLKRLPIAVFTGSDFPTDRARAYALGANSFLIKPLRLEEFYSTLHTAVDFWLDCCKLPTVEPRAG